MILLQGIVQELHDRAECVLVEHTRHILRLGPAPLCGVNKLRHLQQPLGLHGHKHMLDVEVGHLVGWSKDLGQREFACCLTKCIVKLFGEAGTTQASIANIGRAADTSFLPLKYRGNVYCMSKK